MTYITKPPPIFSQIATFFEKIFLAYIFAILQTTLDLLSISLQNHLSSIDEDGGIEKVSLLLYLNFNVLFFYLSKTLSKGNTLIYKWRDDV